MTKILLVMMFFFGLLVSGFIYAEDDDCTRTVTCSDGMKIVDTLCSYSYSIINGQLEGDYPDGQREHKHHHGDDSDDPCRQGHGHRVDNDSDVSDNSENSDDPYGLRHGRHREYDPDDPYGLRQGHNKMINAGSTDQSQP